MLTSLRVYLVVNAPDRVDDQLFQLRLVLPDLRINRLDFIVIGMSSIFFFGLCSPFVLRKRLRVDLAQTVFAQDSQFIKR